MIINRRTLGTCKGYNILESSSGKTHPEYTKYVIRNRVSKEKKIIGRTKFLKVVACLFKHIGKEMVERRGGVMIDKLGYFFVWKIPRKMPNTRFSKDKVLTEYYNYHTKGVLYAPIFVATSQELNCWCMDNRFEIPLKEGINKKIRSGHKYKMYLHSLGKFLNPGKNRSEEI